MYALMSIALFVVALISKDIIGVDATIIAAGLFGIAGSISNVALQMKKEKENKQK